jgi:hypothetical protein
MIPCSVFADGDPVELHTEAQIFMDKVQVFADAHLTIEDFEKDSYISDLQAVAEELDKEADRSGFQAAAYIDGVTVKVEEMKGIIDGYDKKGTCKKDYLEEVANMLVKEYLNDMRDGHDPAHPITTAQYLDDLNRAKDYYTQRLEDLNQEEQASAEYDPDGYLDKSVGGRRQAARIDMQWAGVDDHWLGANLYGVVQQFIAKYGEDRNLAWLSKLWADSEAAATTLAYTDAVYGDWKGKQAGSYASNYYVDEYGDMMSQEDTEDDGFYQSQTTASSSAGARGDGTHNNRGLGYKYNNGTYTTIKITTNGREYTLQESIYTSPLVLDMDGDGKLEASKGKWMPHRYAGGKIVEFDMDGDGFPDLSEWVGANDGLLLQYDSGEVSANNLFGNAGGYWHGFEKLSLLDENSDNKLTEGELDTLSVWQDKNGNAKVDEGELKSVKELGITEISVRHSKKMVSSFVINGKRQKVWDWYPCMYRVKRKK